MSDKVINKALEYIENNELPNDIWVETAKQDLIDIKRNKYTPMRNLVQQVIDYLAEDNLSFRWYSKRVEDIIDRKNLYLLNDSIVKRIVDKVKNDNPDIIKQAKDNPKAINKLIGLSMKQINNRANADTIRKYIYE